MTGMGAVVAVDQGTTNTKAVVVDRAGTTLAVVSQRVAIAFPRPGWVESDPMALWASTVTTLRQATETVDGGIAAIGISNQRETVVAWDRTTGEPLGPAPSWQCTRGADLVTTLDSGADGAARRTLVAERSGLALDPMFSASKMRWLLDHTPGATELAAAGRLALGTVDAWLAFRLSGGAAFVTDRTNASRTALLRLGDAAWDPELGDLWGVPADALPSIVASSQAVGVVACPELPDLAGVPIAALVGDSHAAAVGLGVLRPGGVKATFGTGSSVLAPVADLASVPASLSRTIAWSATSADTDTTTFAAEGNIYATGAALEWVAHLLGLDGDVARLEGLAGSVDDAGGVTLVPAFSGLGAPHWRRDVRGSIGGLTRGAGPGHVARAAFDAVGHQVADVLDALPTELQGELIDADGGAIRSTLLARTVADLTGCTIRRAEHPEVAALGAALLAGLAVGVWPDVEHLAALDRPVTIVEPQLDPAARLAARDAWRAALPDPD